MNLPPRTKAQWKEHAAALYARMEHMQVHVEPDWLFALCTSCGESLEQHPSMVASFRYNVATHECALVLEPLTVQTAQQLEMF